MEIITKYCTGCRACEQICVKNAITMQPDKEGFLVAVIDASKCVDCGLCSKICPQNVDIANTYPIKTLALRYKDDHEILNCASGGVFTAIASAVISEGGVVVGVAYDDYLCAKHIIIDNMSELWKLQSSKYVQADTSNVFSEIKIILNSGKLVLFSGTGCQVAGLKQYLRKDYNNLLTLDLICHGVTSPLMFKKYIEWESHRNKALISNFNFRSKDKGWGLIYTYTYSHGDKVFKKIGTSYDNVYYKHFLNGDAYRECCYSCKYCQPKRTGDITIGDFWGIEKAHPKFYSSKGVSCAIINTLKGQNYFENHKHLFYYIDSTFEKVAERNTNLIRPTKRNNIIRDVIYNDIDKADWFEKLIQNEPKSLINTIKSIVPLSIRRIVNTTMIKIKTFI